MNNKICRKSIAGKQDIFHRDSLNFPKIETDELTYFYCQGPQAWSFWHFRHALAVSGIRQVIAHNDILGKLWSRNLRGKGSVSPNYGFFIYLFKKKIPSS